MTTLTQHKKSVRALASSPKEFTFLSASADNVKKWQARDGKYDLIAWFFTLFDLKSLFSIGF